MTNATTGMTGGSRVKKALIIGGGIAGPVTALALRRAGIEATVHEAYATTADGLGGMLMLAPNGLDALRTVGLDATPLGQPISKMVMGDGRGKRFGEIPGLPGLPPSRLMWRADLYRALHELAAARGVAIELGKRLVGVDETEHGVTARFADGTSATGDVLVGADGIRSRVRALLDPSAPEPRYVGFLGLGGFSSVAPARVEPDAMSFVFGKKAFLGYWTPPTGGTAWFANLPHPTPMTMAEARAIEPREWLRRLAEAYGDDVPGRDLVAHTALHEIMAFGAGEILPSVPCWHRGRMVLVGDAAHAPSSSSGQGASLAIESAVELARCLRDVPEPSRAFAAYEALRRARVEKVAAYGAKQNGNKTAGPVAKALMSLIMPLALRTFLSPQRMFGWMHRHRIDWDAVVTDGRATGSDARPRRPARATA